MLGLEGDAMERDRPRLAGVDHQGVKRVTWGTGKSRNQVEDGGLDCFQLTANVNKY